MSKIDKNMYTSTGDINLIWMAEQQRLKEEENINKLKNMIIDSLDIINTDGKSINIIININK